MAFARACWPPTALDCEDLHRDGGKPPSLKFLGSFGNPSFQLRLHKAAVVQSTSKWEDSFIFARRTFPDRSCGCTFPEGTAVAVRAQGNAWRTITSKVSHG